MAVRRKLYAAFDAAGTVFHEVGHHVHVSKMTDAAAAEWQGISSNGDNCRISNYGRTDTGEHFAEAYRYYASGRQLSLRTHEPATHTFMQRVFDPTSGLLKENGKTTLPFTAAERCRGDKAR